MVSRQNLQQLAYALIKSRIISCEYPPGSFLNTLELQDKLGFSRTPIREALTKLEKENLVNSSPNKGFAVSDVSLSIVKTIYEVRILIEPYIVVQYGALVNRDKLEHMRELLATDLAEAAFTKGRDAAAAYMAHDDELHALLRSGCPNAYLLQILEQIAAQTQRVRIISGYAGMKLKKLCKEHLDIIDAVLAEDSACAGRLMTAHLTRARKNALLAPCLTSIR